MTKEQRGANERRFLNEATVHSTDDINDIVDSIWTDSSGHLFWVNEISPVVASSTDWIARGKITDCNCREGHGRHEDIEHSVGATYDEFLRGRLHGWLRLNVVDEQIYRLQPGQEVRIVITGIVEEPKHYGQVPGEYPAIVIVSGDTNGDRTVLRFTGKNNQAGPTLRGVESVLPTYQIQELP